ncbi:MAG: MOP flippase family protein [Nitrospinae bacterium]|nr:MOP flippase family protein [Nitrospinota bacterium]
MSELHQKATSGFKWTGISSVTTTVLQLVQLLVLARLLAPEDFGLMAMLIVIIGFTQSYSDLGISNAIIHYQKISREQLSSLYWLNLVAGGVIFLILTLSAPLIGLFYNEPRLTDLTFWAALIFLVIPVGQQFQVLLQKELLFKQLSTIEICSSLAGAATAIISAYSGKGVLSLLYGQLANAVCKSILLWVMTDPQWRPFFHFRLSDLKGFLGFGLYQMGERSLNFLGWNLDKMIIGLMLGSHTLGLYSIAYQLVVKPFQMFNPIITRITTPLFSKMQTDNELLRKTFLNMVRFTALAMFPVYIGMIVLAQPLFLLLFGEQWLPAVRVFQVLALLGFFYSIGNLLGSLLVGKGRPDIGFNFNVVVFIVYGIAVWIGTGYGMEGTAWGLVLTTALILFPIGFWIRWHLIQMRPMEYLGAFAPMLISGLLMGGLVYMTHHYMGLSGDTIQSLLFSIFIGGTAYFSLIYFWQKDAVFRLWHLQE